MNNFIEYYKTNNLEVDFFHIAVLENPDKRLDEGRIEFDPNTLNLTIHDMDIYKTYYVTLYLDKQKINKQKMLKFETDDFGRV